MPNVALLCEKVELYGAGRESIVVSLFLFCLVCLEAFTYTAFARLKPKSHFLPDILFTLNPQLVSKSVGIIHPHGAG